MPQDAEVIERLLNLLHEWGWEAGFRRLKEEIESTADPGRRAEMQQFLGWIAAERGHHEQALDYLQQVEQVPELKGWSLYGQAFVANRRKEFTLAHAKLDQAAKHADGDPTLQARLALVRGSAFFSQGQAEMAAVLRRREVIVNQYQGDGFMAVVRGEDHAGRAVLAALDLLRALEQFNKPRRILKLRLLEARIGMHSGSVCFGNLGTYDKMDFTAIGSTAHLAKRIEGNAETGVPCISTATHQLVKDRFVYKPGNPRVLLPSEVKGFDEPCPVWDVVERKP